MYHARGRSFLLLRKGQILGVVLKGLKPSFTDAKTWTVSLTSYEQYKNITLDNMIIQTNWVGGNGGWSTRNYTYNTNTGILTCESTVNDIASTMENTVDIAIIR